MSLAAQGSYAENSSRSGTHEVEHLARRYFELFNSRTLEELHDVLHPDVVLELKAVHPGTVLRGRDEVMAFLEKAFSRRLWEAVVQACETFGQHGAIVAGRLRWMDDERVLRDDPRLWALEFRDGLLLRSVPVHTVSEAEALLSSPDVLARPAESDVMPPA